MKLKYIFCAVAAAAVAALPFVHAASPNTMAGMTMTNTADSTSPGMAASGSSMAGTNSTDAMTALFGDPVIAKGDGVAVKRSDLDEVLTGIKAAAAARGQDIPPDQLTRFEAQMLERLIDIQLLMQHANDADRATGAKKANEAMASLLVKAGSQETLDMQLKAAGTTMDALRTKVTQEATAMATLQRELSVAVTTNDVQKFYDDHPADFEQPEMVHVRHILLMTIDPTTRQPLPDDVVQSKRKEADDVLARARNGEDFAKLAATYSDDPTTKDKGGELPPFGRGQMLPEFEAAAFSLTNNQISDIVTTIYGYHIIKFIDRTPAKKLTLTDEIPQANETISDRIKEALTQQKTDETAQPYLDKLKKAADVQVLDPDLNQAMQELATMTNAVPQESAPSGNVPPPSSAMPGGN
jgi:parvulin-like peptidyl-prolyl isomerase